MWGKAGAFTRVGILKSFCIKIFENSMSLCLLSQL